MDLEEAVKDVLALDTRTPAEHEALKARLIALVEGRPRPVATTLESNPIPSGSSDFGAD